MKKDNLFNKTPKESSYQHKLLKKLRAIPNSWWAVKEAKSIRGLPDIYGCVNGIFVTLEVKRTIEEAQETSGRIVLQRQTILEVQKAGGYAAFIYPENERYLLEELKLLLRHDIKILQ